MFVHFHFSLSDGPSETDEIGCLFGAIGAILYGDKLGRKTTILVGMIVMICGTIIMTCSYGLPEFIVGRSELSIFFLSSFYPLSILCLSSVYYTTRS